MTKFAKSAVTILFVFSVILSSVFCINAKEIEGNKYYLGETVNAGKDTGYSEVEKITEKDPHFGWKLGEFFISGYSNVKIDDKGNPIFLKNVGDKLVLWYSLEQNINKLNGNENLSISEDADGYDEYFEIPKTDFGKGTLILRVKDSENHWGKPTIYTNFLEAKATENAQTQVQIFEEGDYEVALNYEITESKFGVFGLDLVKEVNNYRVFFSFSIRNGNCMAYPFDVKTGDELANSSFTENGFYLDLANSKYLDINIKKEVLNDSSQGLVEDVRFNKPAKDGEKFTDEGIYTITVSNKYTDEQTVKKIYVGTNDVLKAHIKTGFTIEEINDKITLGAKINKNGELISAPTNKSPGNDTVKSSDSLFDNYMFYIVIAGGLLLIIVLVIVIRIVSKKKNVTVSEE